MCHLGKSSVADSDSRYTHQDIDSIAPEAAIYANIHALLHAGCLLRTRLVVISIRNVHGPLQKGFLAHLLDLFLYNCRDLYMVMLATREGRETCESLLFEAAETFGEWPLLTRVSTGRECKWFWRWSFFLERCATGQYIRIA